MTAAPPAEVHATGRARRRAVALCFLAPVAVLVGSYVWLTIDHGTPLLWHVIVHESGRYTLGETVLYFGHFLREVPIAVAYALFLLSASGGVTPARPAAAGRGPTPLGWGFLLAAATLVGGALIAEARGSGLGSALRDLLQYRTRDDLAGYGSHWRYHWLATLWFGGLMGLLPTLSRRVRGLPPLLPHPGWARAAWVYVIGLTLVFGVSTDVFLDARYAGHQAREILTHGPVTALLGVGLLLVAAGRRPSAPAAPADRAGAAPATFAAMVVLIPPWLAVVSLRGDIMAQGQSAYGLGAMVAAHYFEHTLDYLLVLLLLAGGLTSAGTRSRALNRHVASVPAV